MKGERGSEGVRERGRERDDGEEGWKGQGREERRDGRYVVHS